jgi:deoxyribodipyrimidine photo-lyase
MEYNSQRPRLAISEHGRIVQKMIDNACAIEDNERRNAAAKDIIAVLTQLNPQLRDQSDFKHKLWDYLFIASNFKLEVDSPFPKPTAEALRVKPENLSYPATSMRYRHYGKIVEKMIDNAKKIEDPAKTKGGLVIPDGSVDRPTKGEVIAAGEAAALKRFKEFSKSALDSYDEARNLAGIDGTSKMSTYLKFGEIHPRTLLAGLGDSKAHDTFRKEIAWREFYADVLYNNPHTDTDYYAPQFKAMRYDKPGKQFKAWCEGKTGYPFVDAAMRQLIHEGWMHNRTRMVVASFLVKDLHLEWQLGERFFAEHLVDYDVASNAHGWQWTAGTGTDASPYYRVFNPIEQGRRFDEEGTYIRKYVPELAHLSAAEIHEPWLYLDGYSHYYPDRIVDHALERLESLARLQEIKADKPEKPAKS